MSKSLPTQHWGIFRFLSKQEMIDSSGRSYNRKAIVLELIRSAETFDKNKFLHLRYFHLLAICTQDKNYLSVDTLLKTESKNEEA